MAERQAHPIFYQAKPNSGGAPFIDPFTELLHKNAPAYYFKSRMSSTKSPAKLIVKICNLILA